MRHLFGSTYYDPALSFQGPCNVVSTTNCPNNLNAGTWVMADGGTIIVSCDLPTDPGRFLFTSASCR